ncbi:MAG: hypothetical protein JW841_05740 [Deltaproteobacteria bacterium]|nr:hypothetical protein [Deltaproteobacteria bacterium]
MVNDPQTNSGKDEFWHYDIGLNWYIQKNETKMQLNYYRFQYDDAEAEDQVILMAQVAF